MSSRQRNISPISIELVEITLREEVVYDVDLSVHEKVELARALDALGVPVIQLHARGAAEVIAACRDAGVGARFEVLCRPYNPYGYADWRDEIRSAADAAADAVHPSITTPRKWAMGEAGVTPKDVTRHAVDAVKFARDIGFSAITVGFTDVPRTDLGFLIETGGSVVEEGATMLTLNDTVGVAKPALMAYLVRQIKDGTKGRVRVHCHDDFGLATANTLAALAAGADGAELCFNGADPARSGIAPVDEIVMALLCLYRKDLGFRTELLTETARLFADRTGIAIDEQKPVVAERNWMYKRDHIMRTITKDESIQFPYSPSLVGQSFKIGLGRGSGRVGVSAKLADFGLSVSESDLDELVKAVNREAVRLKRRLTDDEFKKLAAAMQVEDAK